MESVCIGLGSNVGDRERNLTEAYDRIMKIPEVQNVKLSHFYETPAEGGPPQPAYLNAAMSMMTELSPFQLLEAFQSIENEMGRIRTVKWGPRIIDIDILLYGDKIIENDTLKIPHPLMHKRLFVLEPLAEIEPRMRHPVFKKTVLQLYNELRK